MLLDISVVVVHGGRANVWFGIQFKPRPQPCCYRVFIGAADIDSSGSFHCGTELRLAFRLRLTQHVFDDALSGFGGG